MSTPIAQFSGAALYLDTTAFYALLRALEPAAKDLFNRIEHGDYRAYTSVLTFDELATGYYWRLSATVIPVHRWISYGSKRKN